MTPVSLFPVEHQDQPDHDWPISIYHLYSLSSSSLKIEF